MRKPKRRPRPFVVFSTAGSLREAEKIAAMVLKKKLCACVNVIKGIDSRFWWRGKINRAKEFLLVIKTDQKRLRELEKIIVFYHSYSIPEIIGLPIEWGHAVYLDWLSETVSSAKRT